MKITKKQQQAVLRVWQRNQGSDKPTGESFLHFRRRVQGCSYDSCVMIQSGSIWLGIEADGYTHS